MSSRPEDSRPENETTLDAWTAPSPEADPDPSGDDEPRQRPDSAAGDAVNGLADVFVNVTGTSELLEEQQEAPSHDPIESDAHETPDLTDDGLDDAADSDLNMGGF